MRSERGSATLEFGLVSIVLLAMIFSLISFGEALYSYHFVADAAREAVRYASVRGSACVGFADCNIDQPGIQNYISTHVPSGITAASVNAQISWPVQPNSPPVCNSIQNSPGCTVSVEVTYPFNFLIPLSPWGTINMQSSSQMIISQ